MLRCLALSLLGLSLLASPAAARGDGPAGGRRAEAGIGSAKPGHSALLHRVAFTRAVAPSGPASCARAAARCRSSGAAAKTVRLSWTQGLPPALGVQAQACPAGTMATLAEGHDDIVRCIPI